MKLINPLCYNYYGEHSCIKRMNDNVMYDMIHYISTLDYYLIDIMHFDFRFALAEIKEKFKFLNSYKEQVFKYCNKKEKEIFFKTLKKTKIFLNKIDEIEKEGYDTILCRNSEDEILINKRYYLPMFKDIKFSYRLNPITFKIVDNFRFYSLTKEQKERFLIFFISKSNFNVRDFTDSIGTSYMHRKLNDTEYIKRCVYVKLESMYNDGYTDLQEIENMLYTEKSS